MEFANDLLDQSVLFKNFGLGLDVYGIVRARRGMVKSRSLSGFKKIFIQPLNLNGSMRLIDARLDRADDQSRHSAEGRGNWQ